MKQRGSVLSLKDNISFPPNKWQENNLWIQTSLSWNFVYFFVCSFWTPKALYTPGCKPGQLIACSFITCHCWRCYRKPWSWREQQRWWEEERPVCLKCMLPDGYTRSSIKISKINLGGLSELGGVLSWFPAVQSKYFHTLGICQRGVWGNGFPEALWPEVPTSFSRGMWRCWGNLWTIWDQSQKGSEDTDFATRGKWPKLQVGPRMTVQM